MPRIVH